MQINDHFVQLNETLDAQLDEDHRFHIILTCVLEISIRSHLTISRVRIDYRPRLSSIHDADAC